MRRLFITINNFYRKISRFLIESLENFIVLFKDVPESYKQNFSYFSQWESKELADDILSKKLSARNDPNWRESGALSPEDYELWSWNICGIACLKMVLDSVGIKIKTINEAKEAEKFGAYKNLGNGEINGVFYEPFCKFINSKYKNLKADFISRTGLKRLKYELSRGRFVIISVSPDIKDAGLKKGSVKKGGHLVLLCGYDERKSTIIVNNPSGHFNRSQECFELSEMDFLSYFANRAIVIEKKIELVS